MSLSISLDESKVGWQHRNFEWHVGEKFPLAYGAVPNVAEIQADGDELITIMNVVHDTVPFGFNPNGGGKRRVQRWFDSDAKFICGMLQMEYRGRE